MPSDAQLVDMIDTVTRGTTVEGAFSLDAFTDREERVLGRQFLELAFLVCSRVPEGTRRTQTLNQIKQARDAAVDARRRG